MKSSTRDKAEGMFHEVKGKVKEVAGKLSDDPNLEAEGTGEKKPEKFRKRLVRSRRLGASSDIGLVCTRRGNEPKTKLKAR